MSDLNTKILEDIRDTLRKSERHQEQTNERLTRVEQALAVLAKITQGIDHRLERIEDREPNRLFLPQRVDALEDRGGRLEAERSKDKPSGP